MIVDGKISCDACLHALESLPHDRFECRAPWCGHLAHLCGQCATAARAAGADPDALVMVARNAHRERCCSACHALNASGDGNGHAIACPIRIGAERAAADTVEMLGIERAVASDAITAVTDAPLVPDPVAFLAALATSEDPLVAAVARHPEIGDLLEEPRPEIVRVTPAEVSRLGLYAVCGIVPGRGNNHDHVRDREECEWGVSRAEYDAAFARAIVYGARHLSKETPAVPTKLRVYVAASGTDLERAARWMEALRRAGVEVVSTWVENIMKWGGVSNPVDKPEAHRALADAQAAEVDRADILWLLMPPGSSYGAFWELGRADALNRPTYVSGAGVARSIFTARSFRFEDDLDAFATIVRDAGRMADPRTNQADETAEARDQGFTAGMRAAHLQHLTAALRGLEYEGTEANAAKWVVEREETVALLRSLCEMHGDNDWPNDLHLRDVIEKHLMRPLGLDG